MDFKAISTIAFTVILAILMIIIIATLNTTWSMVEKVKLKNLKLLEETYLKHDELKINLLNATIKSITLQLSNVHGDIVKTLCKFINKTHTLIDYCEVKSLSYGKYMIINVTLQHDLMYYRDLNLPYLELTIIDSVGQVGSIILSTNCSDLTIKFFEVYPRSEVIKVRNVDYLRGYILANLSYTLLLKSRSNIYWNRETTQIPNLGYYHQVVPICLNSTQVHIINTTDNTYFKKPWTCNITETDTIVYSINYTNLTINPTWTNTTHITCKLPIGAYIQPIKLTANGTCNIDTDISKIKVIACLNDTDLWTNPETPKVCVYLKIRGIWDWRCVDCERVNENIWRCRFELWIFPFYYSCRRNLFELQTLGYVVIKDNTVFLNVSYCQLWRVNFRGFYPAAIVLPYNTSSFRTLGKIKVIGNYSIPESTNKTGILFINYLNPGLPSELNYTELYNPDSINPPAFKQEDILYYRNFIISVLVAIIYYSNYVPLNQYIAIYDSPEYVGIYVEADPYEYSEATWYGLCFIPVNS